MITKTSVSQHRAALCLLAFVALSFAASGQQPSKNPKQSPPKVEHDEGWVRDVAPKTPCKFAPVFQRISDNKKDPRVAFVELVWASNLVPFQ